MPRAAAEPASASAPEPGPGPVPIIDLRDEPEVVDRQVAAAAASVGLMRVRGHGLEILVNGLLAAARASFQVIDADPRVAAAVAAGPDYAGYTGPQGERLDDSGDAPTEADLHRTWNWSTWTTAPWGPLPPEFGRLAALWQQRAERLLTGCFLPGLSIAARLDLAAAYGVPRVACRINDYPPYDRDPRPGQMRAGAHRDYGPLTAVVPDGPGLQVEVGGQWVDVPYDPAELVVNVGDELRALAAHHGTPAGSIAPARHRVLAPPAPQPPRQSLVCFWFGASDTIVDTDRDGTPVTSTAFVMSRVHAAQTGDTPSRDAQTDDTHTGDTHTVDAQTGGSQSGATEMGNPETGDTETGDTETTGTETRDTETSDTETSDTEANPAGTDSASVGCFAGTGAPQP